MYVSMTFMKQIKSEIINCVIISYTKMIWITDPEICNALLLLFCNVCFHRMTIFRKCIFLAVLILAMTITTRADEDDNENEDHDDDTSNDCKLLSQPFKLSRCIKHNIVSLNNDLITSNLGGLQRKLPGNCFNSNIYFFNFHPTSSHLHLVAIRRLYLDKDDNGIFSLTL